MFGKKAKETSNCCQTETRPAAGGCGCCSSTQTKPVEGKQEQNRCC